MEILAPAGDFNCLKAAVFGGADAVYVGGNKFSARKNATNFDDDELIRAVDFCHLFGVKIYVAINILIKDSEMKNALSFLEFVREIGADGVIIQDLGLMKATSVSFPDLKINASTQMTIHSLDGVNAAKELGAKRVVLSRELDFNDIKKISEKTDMELEVFVHGALCMSYSGQCLLSSIIGGRSGNRGACAQPCRLNYSLFLNGKEKTKSMPLLSPKDLCLVREIGELEKAGVSSLKIEGRMKSPEYVGLVSRVYKDAAEGKIDDEEVSKMLASFSRGGGSKGYFYGRSFGKMMDYENGAKINKDVALESLPERKIPVEFNFVAKKDSEIMLTATSNGKSVCVFGEKAEEAQKVALTEERAVAQIEKLGQTFFYAEKTVCSIDENVAVSIKAINELRRTAVEKLLLKIAQDYKKEHKDASFSINKRCEHKEIAISCEVKTAEAAILCREMGIERVYVPISEKNKISNKDDFIFTLPAILKDADACDLDGIKSICAQNIGQLDKDGVKIHAGHRLNVFNKTSAKVLEEMGAENIVLSPELNLKEIEELSPHLKNTPDVIAYGRLPLMIMENCPAKSAHKCILGQKDVYLKDRMGEKFLLMCENCRSVLLNSKVIFMADKIDELKAAGVNLRLLFTTENSDEILEIIKKYKAAIAGEKVLPPLDNYTRGHLKRGVM